MAGLYIHIPFCASRCIYCGFYSTTLPALSSDYISAICQEMVSRRRYVSEPLSSVYLGGGTPSQLTIAALEQLFECADKTWGLSNVEELTMECNPDDITDEYAKGLSSLPVDRISLGVQTFSNERLRFLHRRHTSQQVYKAISLLRKNGFNNISIDLMFGFPNETTAEWGEDIEKAIELDVEHISAYSLMYETGTPLFSLLQQGKINELDEDITREMYEQLMLKLKHAGYEHYEISNFSKPSCRSLHNSNYWKGIPYIGIGAAAHSYNKESRQWNIADIKEYMKRIESGTCTFERENLDLRTQYNDMVTTALRTCEGISLNQVQSLFGKEYRDYLLDNAKKNIGRHLLTLENDCLRLTRKGIFVSDDIMSDLIAISTPE